MELMTNENRIDFKNMKDVVFLFNHKMGVITSNILGTRGEVLLTTNLSKSPRFHEKQDFFFFKSKLEAQIGHFVPLVMVFAMHMVNHSQSRKHCSF